MVPTRRAIWRLFCGMNLALLVVGSAHLRDVRAQPQGQMTHAIHFTLAPTFFHPSETREGSSFLLLYALHDALVESGLEQFAAPLRNGDKSDESWVVQQILRA